MDSVSHKILKGGGSHSLSVEQDRAGLRLTRRAFLRRLGLATGAAVTLAYVRPALLTKDVSEAFAAGLYPPPTAAGLTPGYWKNWSNKYTSTQFEGLLADTFVADIPTADSILEIADAILSDYDAAPGEEMTILRVFLLAVQLNIALMSSGLPVPPDVYLDESSLLSDGTTLGSAIGDGLSLEANYPYPTPGVSSGDRPLALAIKDRLEELLTA